MRIGLVLPVMLLVRCEAPTVKYAPSEDERFLDQALGEWADPGDPTRTLRLCEDTASAYCERYRRGVCQVDGECHDIRGGGRGRSQDLSTANGCEGNCARAAGVAIAGELMVAGVTDAIAGRMEASGEANVDLPSPGYAPPYLIELSTGVLGSDAGRPETAITGAYDGTTLEVTVARPDGARQDGSWTKVRSRADACANR